MNTGAGMKLTPIHFGTDGWRAVIADEFTFSNLERISQAYARYLTVGPGQLTTTNESPSRDALRRKLVVIGYDRRFLSKEFAHRVAEIMAGNGLEILGFDHDVPTPLVSWAVRETQALGGVTITASHNPPEFNGFKIKAPWGGSASTSITTAVESYVDEGRPQRSKVALEFEESKATISSYYRHVSDYIDLDLIGSVGKRIVVDPMHGSGGYWVESFLRGTKIEIDTIRGERDPTFEGVPPEPIDRHLGALKTKVAATGALIGLATDGDADRLGAVNELGETMTMHEVVPLLLLHLIREKKMSGAVVTTFSQSVLTKRIAAAHDLKIFETPIGFKYIADLMLEHDILIGAEESGGIGLKGHLPERDGILNSLLLLEAVVAGGKTPSELVLDVQREFGTFFFDRRDLRMDVAAGQDLVNRVAVDPPVTIGDHKVSTVETMDGTKLIFADESWLLLRQSGTEPVLRLYSEATSRAKVQSLLDGAQTLARAV